MQDDLFGVGKGGYVSKVLKNGILLPSVSILFVAFCRLVS